MNQVSATSRRVVRTLAHRQIDWDRQIWKVTPAAASKMNALRAWAASADAMAEKYKTDPAPIDFSSAKSKIRDQGLVDALEKFYSSNTPPPEVHEQPPPEPGAEDIMAEAADYQEFTQELRSVVEAEIEFMKESRTSMSTTGDDIEMGYPLISEEVEEEIDERKWFKDVGLAENN